MLKTVSSIVNAIGALNYKGTWNASTNSPALASGVGTKGDYYVVGTAGSTTLDGISNWGIGDWAAFNGSVWQRVEGGADLNGVNLSVSGTSTLSGLTASTALALNASKEVVSVTNTGTGNNVLATSPTFITDTTHSYLTASSAVATDANKKLVSVTNTGSGSNVLATSPTIATPNITGDTILAADATPSNGNQRFRNINIGAISAGGNSVVTVFPIYYRGFGSIDVNVVAYSITDGSEMRAETQIFFSYSNNTLLVWGMKTPTYTQSIGENDWRAGAPMTIAIGSSSNNLTLTITSTSGALTTTRVFCQDFISTN
jgi:hypothetical protein